MDKGPQYTLLHIATQTPCDTGGNGKEKKRQRIILEGDVPSPANPPVGCNFSTRCPVVMDICREKEPEFKDYGGGHWVACFRAD